MADHWQVASAVGSIVAGFVALATLINKGLRASSYSILQTMGLRFDAVDKRLESVDKRLDGVENGQRSLDSRAQTNSEKIARMEARHEAEDRTVKPLREVRS